MRRLLLIVSICILIFACSKITRDKFDQIKPGMTMQQVTALLGEPTTTESVNIAGISGTSATWKTRDAEIDIQFLNNLVTIKAFSKPVEKKIENMRSPV